MIYVDTPEQTAEQTLRAPSADLLLWVSLWSSAVDQHGDGSEIIRAPKF